MYKWLLCVAFLLASVASVFADDQADLSRKLIDRHRSVDRLEASFARETDYTPPAEFVDKLVREGLADRANIRTGVRKSMWVFGRNGSMFFLGWRDGDVPIASDRPIPGCQFRNYSVERSEVFSWWDQKGGRPSGLITEPRGIEESDITLDVALGLRFDGSRELASAQDLGGMQIGAVDSECFEATGVRDNGWTHVWRCHRDDGRIMSVLVRNANGVRIATYEVKAWSELDGVMLPAEVVGRRFFGKQDADVSVTEHLRILGWKRLNAPEGEQLYKWPKGTQVFDERLNLPANVASGDRTLPDAFLQELHRRQISAEDGQDTAATRSTSPK